MHIYEEILYIIEIYSISTKCSVSFWSITLIPKAAQNYPTGVFLDCLSCTVRSWYVHSSKEMSAFMSRHTSQIRKSRSLVFRSLISTFNFNNREWISSPNFKKKYEYAAESLWSRCEMKNDLCVFLPEKVLRKVPPAWCVQGAAAAAALSPEHIQILQEAHLLHHHLAPGAAILEHMISCEFWILWM